MHVVVVLHQDGDSELKYLVDRIFVQEKTIQEYTELYPNRIILFQEKGYLNGEVVASRPCLKSSSSRINVDLDKVDVIESIGEYDVDEFGYPDDASGWDPPSDDLRSVTVYGNMYYIVETDGSNFELNQKINGYGSFAFHPSGKCN